MLTWRLPVGKVTKVSMVESLVTYPEQRYNLVGWNPNDPMVFTVLDSNLEWNEAVTEQKRLKEIYEYQ